MSAGGSSSSRRPYLGVLFECCGIYQRVYRDANGDKYRGRCPRCLRTVTFTVGPHGSAQRFYRAR